MACIPPNPRKVGYIVPIHGPLDGPLYMGSIYSNTDDSNFLLSKDTHGRYVHNIGTLS